MACSSEERLGVHIAMTWAAGAFFRYQFIVDLKRKPSGLYLLGRELVRRDIKRGPIDGNRLAHSDHAVQCQQIACCDLAKSFLVVGPCRQECAYAKDSAFGRNSLGLTDDFPGRHFYADAGWKDGQISGDVPRNGEGGVQGRCRDGWSLAGIRDPGGQSVLQKP